MCVRVCDCVCARMCVNVCVCMWMYVRVCEYVCERECVCVYILCGYVWSRCGTYIIDRIFDKGSEKSIAYLFISTNNMRWDTNTSLYSHPIMSFDA